MKEIDIGSLSINPMQMIGDDWWVIAAGNETNGYNAMTASWGHLGSIWKRPKGKAHRGLSTAVVYVRPQRYTKEYLDREELFSLSVFGEQYRKALGYLGSHSGKDGDKISQAGLHPIFTDDTIVFSEARLTFICRKLYHAPLQESGFVDTSLIEANYPQKDFHEMYVGEILRVLVPD